MIMRKFLYLDPAPISQDHEQNLIYEDVLHTQCSHYPDAPVEPKADEGKGGHEKNDGARDHCYE
jgi:hypothetical protein